MYAWTDLCGSREIGVKSQAMHKGRLRGWSREIETKGHGADPCLTIIRLVGACVMAGRPARVWYNMHRDGKEHTEKMKTVMGNIRFPQ